MKDDGIELVPDEKRSPVRRFQVLGMRCSGTNFVSALLAANTSLEWSSHLGWKHGFPSAEFVPADLLPIVVFRDPFDWIRSLHRKPWHFRDFEQKKTFSQFIRDPVDTRMDAGLWTRQISNAVELLPRTQSAKFLLRNWLWPKVQRRFGVRYPQLSQDVPEFAEQRELQLDRHPITGEAFANPLQLRNTKTKALLGYAMRNCSAVFVRYEFVSGQPERFLALLAETFGIRLKSPFTPVSEWVGEIYDDAVRSAPPAISPEDARFILSELDLSNEDRLGYEDSVESHVRLAGFEGRHDPAATT